MAGVIDRVVGGTQAALGKAEGAVGSALNNQSIKDLGDSHVKQGEVKSQTHSSSHAGSAGPFSATTGGGFATQNSDRTEGSWNSKVGEAKQKVGEFVGSDSYTRSGVEQQAEGNAQKTAGTVKDAAQGVGERVHGAVGGAAAGLVGNRTKQDELNRLGEDGKARLDGLGN